jgi:hypothetical protein
VNCGMEFLAFLALLVGVAWIFKRKYRLRTCSQVLRHRAFLTMLAICCAGITIFYIVWNPPYPSTWKGSQLVAGRTPDVKLLHENDLAELGDSVMVQTGEHECDVGFKIPDGFRGRKCTVKYGITVKEGRCRLILSHLGYGLLETSLEIKQPSDGMRVLSGFMLIPDEPGLYAVIRVGEKSKVIIHYGHIELIPRNPSGERTKDDILYVWP